MQLLSFNRLIKQLKLFDRLTSYLNSVHFCIQKMKIVVLLSKLVLALTTCLLETIILAHQHS